MKLTDLVNSVRYKFREVENFIRYPLQNVYRIGRRAAEEKIEQIEVPVGKGDRSEAPQRERQAETSSNGVVYREPVQVPRPTTSLQTQTTPQPTRRIPKIRSQPRPVEIPPALPEKQEIRGGRRGRYRIERLLKDGEKVRLYEGTQLLNSKPVVIKEYLLSDRDFNREEARERKEQFERLASLNLKNSGVQDFRLIAPWDAIASQNERRCYLITEHIPHTSSTLGEYLAKTGVMPAKQVRQVLNQLLQTLWFLHNHKFRLSTGEVQQGIAHGNLSLDSLLIASNDQQPVSDEQQFYIYVSDLALWEHLFSPPTTSTVNSSLARDFVRDLRDLGYVSFYLLSGGTVEQISGQPLDPKIEQHWFPTNDRALEKFIERLLGLEGSFRSAEEARQELLRLPPEKQSDRTDSPIESEEEEVESSRSYRPLLTALALGFLFGFTWGFIGLLTRWVVNRPSTTVFGNFTEDNQSEKIQIDDVTDIPNRTFTYTVVGAKGTWSYVMKSPSLVAYGKTLEQELRDRNMKLQLSYEPVGSIDDAIAKVQEGKSDFSIARLDEDSKKKIETANFQAEEFAYEGIVVFVAFSDAQRTGSIPEALNGKTTFKQLRELYTGNKTNWNQVKDSMSPLPVDLYIPTEPEAVKLFEELVFEKQPQSDRFKFPKELNEFREARAKGKIIQKETLNTFGDVLGKFENEDNPRGAISFGLLSKVFGQCSVYPLAVGGENQEVQALVIDNGNPVEPSTDLCNDKGSYRANVQAFKSGRYTLGYPLAIVYPEEDDSSSVGAKFAEILRTKEGQCLLNEAGLVPLRDAPCTMTDSDKEAPSADSKPSQSPSP